MCLCLVRACPLSICWFPQRPVAASPSLYRALFSLQRRYLWISLSSCWWPVLRGRMQNSTSTSSTSSHWERKESRQPCSPLYTSHILCSLSLLHFPLLESMPGVGTKIGKVASTQFPTTSVTLLSPSWPRPYHTDPVFFDLPKLSFFSDPFLPGSWWCF